MCQRSLTLKRQTTSDEAASEILNMANRFRQQQDSDDDESSTASSSNGSTSSGSMPGPFDVICARGKKAYTSPGNRYFKTLVEDKANEYKATKTKFEKTLIVSEILDQVRFVREDKSGCWHQVADSVAREKVGSAFRDVLHENYRSSGKEKRQRKRLAKMEKKKQQAEKLSAEIALPATSLSATISLETSVLAACQQSLSLPFQQEQPNVPLHSVLLLNAMNNHSQEQPQVHRVSAVGSSLACLMSPNTPAQPLGAEEFESSLNAISDDESAVSFEEAFGKSITMVDAGMDTLGDFVNDDLDGIADLQLNQLPQAENIFPSPVNTVAC